MRRYCASRSMKTLETSLVEWKRASLGHTHQGDHPLETSLVEWKRRVSILVLSAFVRALETSLVEWKLGSWSAEVAGGNSLETSLVEWKLVTFLLLGKRTLCLGNFLSGMETPSPPAQHPSARGTLETSLVEWKHGYTVKEIQAFLTLETSLVEWKLRMVSPLLKRISSLGNFLSGMETVDRRYAR